MRTYIGTKVVSAELLPIEEIEKVLERKVDNSTNPDAIEGYLVEYEDGYKSYSPKDVFERAYRPTNLMTFGQAIEALKKGYKVARQGWNGKGMYLWLKPATTVQSEWCKDTVLKDIADKNDGSILALGTICMYTHDSTGRKAILTGWLASQSDMLLEDWVLVS